MIVLSLFDYSGVMVKPWLEAGYECIIVDLQHPHGWTIEGNLKKVGCDILHWLPPNREYEIVFAFPPCTDLATSGARWFKDKGLAGLGHAIKLVEKARDICEWTDSPWMIENPISTLSSYWRKPDHIFHPWMYGDNYSKTTCLWTDDRFVMPEPLVKEKPKDVNDKYIHHMPGSKAQAMKRSETPEGFTRAVFEANAEL